MKVHLPNPVNSYTYLRRLLILNLLLSVLLAPSESSAQNDPNPLKPADTTSPRATLKSFVDNMNSWYKLIKTRDGKGPASQTPIFKIRAVRCLDLSKIDQQAVENLGPKRAVLLSEILDRIELPALESVPDADQVDEEEEN